MRRRRGRARAVRVGGGTQRDRQPALDRRTAPASSTSRRPATGSARSGGNHTLAIGDFDGGRVRRPRDRGRQRGRPPGHIADGAINVLYGTAAGLTAARDQFWNQESPGILGDSDLDYDSWGSRVVAADFNGDGYADLALCSQEDLGLVPRRLVGRPLRLGDRA